MSSKWILRDVAGASRLLRSILIIILLCATITIAQRWRSVQFRGVTAADGSHAAKLSASKEEALATPVVVAVKTHHFFGEYAREVPGCTFEGKPMNCTFVDRRHGPMPEADALWYHLPNMCGQTLNRDAPHQLTVGMSMEASTYYSCLDDQSFMDQFDIEMTYRKCSHVIAAYFISLDHLNREFFNPPLPFENQRNAIAYINSNCGALNGRNTIVEELMNLQKLPVESWGQCLRNKVAPTHTFDKVQVFKQYKFCISMENSNTIDYVTEKIWQALSSGCLPIYWGAPNIMDFVPHPDSIIDYQKFGTPQKLMNHLVELSNNKALYDVHHQWRTLPFDQLSPGFRKMVLAMTSLPHTQCQVCSIIMNHRLNKNHLSQTHCLRNQTWLDAAKTGGSTWGPGSDALLQLPGPLTRYSSLSPQPGPQPTISRQLHRALLTGVDVKEDLNQMAVTRQAGVPDLERKRSALDAWD